MFTSRWRRGDQRARVEKTEGQKSLRLHHRLSQIEDRRLHQEKPPSIPGERLQAKGQGKLATMSGLPLQSELVSQKRRGETPQRAFSQKEGGGAWKTTKCLGDVQDQGQGSQHPADVEVLRVPRIPFRHLPDDVDLCPPLQQLGQTVLRRFP